MSNRKERRKGLQVSVANKSDRIPYGNQFHSVDALGKSKLVHSKHIGTYTCATIATGQSIGDKTYSESLLDYERESRHDKNQKRLKQKRNRLGKRERQRIAEFA